MVSFFMLRLVLRVTIKGLMMFSFLLSEKAARCHGNHGKQQ